MTLEANTYFSLDGNQRSGNRNFARFTYANGRIESTTGKSSAFNPARGFDGQSLAGTGALVFEGELLEFPR